MICAQLMLLERSCNLCSAPLAPRYNRTNPRLGNKKGGGILSSMQQHVSELRWECTEWRSQADWLFRGGSGVDFLVSKTWASLKYGQSTASGGIPACRYVTSWSSPRKRNLTYSQWVANGAGVVVAMREWLESPKDPMFGVEIFESSPCL